MHTLYLCYFGLREPLVQTQVLPYLRELLKDNHQISLLTFEPNFKEKWSQGEIVNQKAELANENIDWYCLPYHKRPSVPATAFDIANGARFAQRMIREKGVNVLHARVHVPAMMGALAKIACRGKHVKLLFDIRGFMPEEYTDAGVWQADSRLYRNVKKVEKWLLAKSDAFVVLTEKARDILFPESAETSFDQAGRPVAVIPCCVDFKRFGSANGATRQEVRRELKLDQRQVIIYVGALGGWYLTEDMADFFAHAKQQNPKTFALVLTQSQPEIMINLLRKKGFTDVDFLVTKVLPEAIPDYLSAADIALSFIKPCFSKLSSSPTKIAEYLAAGLPVVANSGVGDVEEMITTDGVGAVINNFDLENYRQALREIEDLRQNSNLADRCRESARQRFDLVTVGGAKYRSLYDKLLKETH